MKHYPHLVELALVSMLYGMLVMFHPFYDAASIRALAMLMPREVWMCAFVAPSALALLAARRGKSRIVKWSLQLLVLVWVFVFMGAATNLLPGALVYLFFVWRLMSVYFNTKN